VQAKLVVGQVDDPLEHAADHVADRVMRMPAPPLDRDVTVQRCCAACEKAASETDQRSTTVRAEQSSPVVAGGSAVPATVDEVLNSAGDPLDGPTRAFFEPRFGQNFAQVRVHTDDRASTSAHSIGAHAYTLGSHVVFAAGEYAPTSDRGQHLLAHELAHVVQQRADPCGSPVRRQLASDPAAPDMGDAAAQREYGNGPAPKAQKCGSPSHCPPGFCQPYSSQKLAEYYRAKDGGWLLAGVSSFVDSRVAPLWSEYLSGGSPPKNLTSTFGKDFTNSPTTRETTDFLVRRLKLKLDTMPFLMLATTTLDIRTVIPNAIAAIGDPTSSDQMNFAFPRDVAGNLAGGIGKDQQSCPAGAQPSPFNDERDASGTVTVSPLSATELTVTPDINFRVKDTIDLCPGDCGTTLEQFATVPFSQFEATGISGDVPFIIDFPAPPTPAFTITPPPLAGPPPLPKPAPPKSSSGP